MRFRLFQIVAAAALLSGGWGGALASALCPHGGGSSHAAARGVRDCCRARLKRKAAAASHADASHATTSHCETGPSRPGAGETHHAERRGHEATHETTDEASPHDATRHEVETGERAAGGGGDESASGLATAFGAGLCAHCVGRRAPAPSTASGKEAETARREACGHEPSVRPRLISPSASFPPEIVPSQHAPPATRRHVLHGVFLI